MLPEGPLAEWMASEAGLTGARIDQALSGGNANLTVRLHTDTGPVVLRTPPESAISPKAHRGIEREAMVLRSLEGSVKAPRVLGWCDDPAVIGRPFLLVSYVDGVSLTETLPQDYADTAASVNSLGEQLVDELAAIHRLPWRDAGLEDFGNPENFLGRQIARWRDIRAASTVRELPQIESLGQWLESELPDAPGSSLIHGDYHLDNTLCRRDRPELAAVIDWELATIGDPLTDIGLLLMFWGGKRLAPMGFPHVQAVTRRDGVVGRRELAARWSAATGIAIDNIEYYLCFAFWRLAAIVEGAYQLYVEGKVDTDYARGLEQTVPALLAEAEAAASGDW